MGTVIPVGFAQVTIVMRGPGATKNSTWSLGAEPSGIGGMPGLFDVWEEALTNAERPCNTGSMVVGWQYLGMEATFMDETGPLMFSRPASITGTKEGSPLPVNCAFLISKATARGGRSGRGRIFFPPALLGESGVDGQGIISSGIIPTLSDYFSDMLDDMQTGLLPPFLLHDGEQLPNEIIAFNLQSQLATQRRRMR